MNDIPDLVLIGVMAAAFIAGYALVSFIMGKLRGGRTSRPVNQKEAASASPLEAQRRLHEEYRKEQLRQQKETERKQAEEMKRRRLEQERRR